jgi:ubiquinone/menaquinone biosynthesis C-methylase UbiE
MLDLGSGAGRHSFEAMSRGGTVMAVDSDPAEVKDVSWTMRGLMAEDQKVRAAGGWGAAVVGDGLALPFPGRSFDRVVAAEVL